MKATPNRACRFYAKSVLLIVCLLISVFAYAKTPSWVRAASSGGSGDDISYAVKVGPDNNPYVTGRFSGTAVFSGTTLVSAGGTDIYLAKYGPSGKLLWIVQAGGTSDDTGLGLAFDNADNVYLTGGFTTSATFGSTDGATKTVTGTGETIFLAKYRSSGALLWVQTGVAGYDEVNTGFGIAVNGATGSVYIAASSQGEITFSSANGAVNTVSGVGTWHMVLIKYDTSGNFQWGETNAGEPNSLAYDVAVDANDNAYIIGWLENETTFYSNDGNDITVVGFSPGQSDGNYPDDAFLVKYDTTGNVKWVNHIGGYKGIASAVAVNPINSNVTLVGLVGNINYGSQREADTTASSQAPGVDRDLGGGVFTDPYNQDGFIVTYDTNGVIRGAVRFGYGEWEVATGVTYDPRGNLYVTGVFQGVNDPQNLFVVKYSGTTQLWTKAGGNAGEFNSDNATVISPAIAVDTAGRVFVTGGYFNTATFGDITLQSTGIGDIFLAELAVE